MWPDRGIGLPGGLGSLGRGDVLTVCSLRCLADDPARLREGLERVWQTGGIVESLGEPRWDMRAEAPCWEQLDSLYGPGDMRSFSCSRRSKR